ncbi:ESF1 homolog [Gadus macrocephalus]|uniref:ESF1 homolog n=1 Tax=Gadus macrocephalus TaxID=80720 RepID=UPI0028CB7B7D|nr:ESF1 homolog [Gadus macrocephalus]XP_059903974.1 ESF1 homolog [Gadus macrocephalus]
MSNKPNEDARFRRVQKDPRFWEMPDREQKVQIDKRFQAMFKDKRFQVKQTVDKRGRPVNHTAKEDLRRFYNLSESEGEEVEEPGKKEGKKKKVAVKTGAPPKEAEDEEGEEDDSELEGGSADEEESAEEESGLDSGSEDDSEPDLARGVGNVETSSDEDEEEDEVESLLRREEEEIQHDWGDLCKDAPRGEEVWPRLAVCNLDWDRLKAKDLLALFNSFKPAGGVVLSVKIYPSEFGKERLQMEQSQGPLELLVSLPEDPEKDSEEEKVHREKLRDYQFKRLRYFFAVVECDSAETAAKIYSECDGFEYESSSSILDLRFIPDDVVFDEEPKEVATEVELTTYTPKLFTSSAAATSKVEVTWDETDHDRIQALNRHFNKSDLMDMDFNAYLASSSEEEEEQEEEQAGALEPEEKAEDKPAGGQREGPPVEEEEEEEDKRRRRKNKKKSGEEQIARYRELLKGIQQKESQQRGDNEMEMEVSWVPGLRETTERLVKKKMEVQEQRTPWEDYLEKKKERRKQRRNQEGEAESNLADEDDEDDVPSDVDLNDPYFAEELGASAGVKKKPTKKKEEESSEEDEELEKRKAEMSLLMGDDEDEKHNHFNFEKIVELQNLSKKKKKKLQKKSQEDLPKDNFQVDVADPRFQAVFTSHLFNLDPSDPNFRKTRGTDTIVAEKLRRRAQQETHRRRKQEVPTQIQEAAVAGSAGGGAEKKSLDPSLSLLVKSVKNKTQQFQAGKKPRLM